MRDWFDLGMLALAVAFISFGFLNRVRLYRSLIWGAGVLATITALGPRPGNDLAIYFFGAPSAFPAALLGFLWWILGAWLMKSLLNIVLRRTLFPNDDQPHSRRLFADLIFIVVYIIALIGIMDTVFKQSFSAVLATSGVLAVILGLALQSTLADFFSGLALNVDRPFRSGDWITLAGNVEGQVMEINWRATRLKTLANSIINIPNSVIAKGIVTNHRTLKDPLYCTIQIRVDHSVAPSRVIDALTQSAAASEGTTPAVLPTAYATSFEDTIILYELSFAIADFPQMCVVRSDVICRITENFNQLGIQLGEPATDIHIIRRSPRDLSDNLARSDVRGVAIRAPGAS